MTAQHWFGPTEGSVEVDYDGRGRVTAQTVEGVALGFGYDADGLLTSAGSLTLSRGATTGWVESVGVGGVTQTLVHDEYGEVAGSSYVQGGETLYGYTLERDALGRIVGETEQREGEAAVEWAYAYDARGRLEQVERDGLLYAAYEYDPNGNRTSVTTSEGSETGFADAQDRLAEFGQCEFGYDANGAMATRVCGVGQVWAYEYDALGLLRSVTLPDARVVSYAYDAGGRPVARYVDGVYTRGWLWGSALEPVAELDAEGEVEARYVYASRGHVPDLVIRAEGTYRLITDYRGSVVAVVHVGSGEVVETFEYGPWGEVVSHEGGRTQAFGYAGGLWDEDTGLVLFGARWYDAGLGRWLSKDPARFGGGVNFYAYVENRPIGAIDPLGLVPHRPYSTEQEAALEAARWIEILLPKDDVVSHEYAGLIYEMGGYFYHTNPLYDPSLGDTHARPGLALGECPASSTPTAGFHSHPPITGYDQRAASEGDRHYVSVATPLYMVTFDSEGRGGGLYGLAQWEGDEYLHWDYHYLEEIWP